jgi:long-subunit acyl-CoA synthetase (AMP-forming)
MMGYLGQPQKTDEVIDEDGWLRSGDIGARDNDGFLTVTGRIKEIIITAGGENIPPAIIEEEIKASLSIVG